MDGKNVKDDERKKKRKVSTRKMVKRSRRKGTYKPKQQDNNIPIGIGDPDIAACIFSDEEIEAEFVDNHTRAVNEDNGIIEADDAKTEGYFTSADFPGVSASGNISDSAESRSDSTIDSRPSSSSSSRPDSSLAIDVSIPFSSDSEAGQPSCSNIVSPTFPSDMEMRPPSSSSVASSSRTKTVEPPAVDLHSILGAIIPPADIKCRPSFQCIERCLNIFKSILPVAWVVICGRDGFHLLFLSDVSPKAVQKEVLVHFNGTVSIFVHCNTIMNKKKLLNNSVPPLEDESEATLQEFCAKGSNVVKALMDYTVCVGANHEGTKSVWNTIPETVIDLNPYRETGYSQTCRSMDCYYLVEKGRARSIRCAKCGHIFNKLKKREEFLKSETAHLNTRNVVLTPVQAVHKLAAQQEEIRRLNNKVSYLEEKMKIIFDEEGVDVEDHVSCALQHILKSNELTENQKLFLEQQLKNAGKSDPRQRRWHPTMIRLALFLKDKTTNSAYESVRDTGMIQLPSSRTLFDYSHAMVSQEGINEDIVEHVSEKVEQLPKSYQKFHVVLCDEVYVSQNLVYRVSDNSLIGYEKLHEVEKEIKEFESHIEQLFSGKEIKWEEQMAKTMLAYMVKGIASRIKYVVAAFPIKDLKCEMMYSRTWTVILALEKAGIKVIALVCDGAPTNRAFINMHTPITKCKSKVIFDTINICSPDWRPLFFISDVCHLVKTIRNCLYNSGDGEKKTRCMEINGEKLQWKPIIRLYLKNKDCNFRKTFKLNAQNVFPNKFSCMSVKNAAQVLSDSVAQDIEEQGWAGTTELVKFLRYVNKFFDCLNGAHAGHGIRTRNENLSPYCDVNDVRLDWLGVPNPNRSESQPMPYEEKPFLQYLEDWQKQARENKNVEAKARDKLLLAQQTLHGIEMAIRGFSAAVRYMLGLPEPPAFINARVFSQDPLEQHFSVQRAAGGGNRNPNASQFLNKQVSVTVQRDIGVRTRKSNATEVESIGMEITEEPLPKRSRKKQ